MIELPQLRAGQVPSTKQYNDLVKRVNALTNARGTDGITTRMLNGGLVISGAGVDTGLELRRAFVKTPPGASTSAICFLDTDTTGREIEVNSGLYTFDCASASLASSRPNLVDGTPIWVTRNKGVWHSVTTINFVEECS